MAPVPIGSYFVSGTDTNVGKTLIASGMARIIREGGTDVGVMKPFACGAPPSGRSDIRMLLEAAGSGDPEDLANPQLFPVDASPLTAWAETGMKPDVDSVLEAFREIQSRHDVLLVEGIGGIMAPILPDYLVSDMIRQMSLPAIIVVGNRIGSISHALMTLRICELSGIEVAGIVINCLDPAGYAGEALRRDLRRLTGTPILGVIPRIGGTDIEFAAEAVRESGILRF